MNAIIETFLRERRDAKLKKEKDPEKIAQIKTDFLLKNWLPNAAKRAGQLSFTSHPAKFSHPDIKKDGFYQFIATPAKEKDGFLRSGNAHGETDINGNAAAMDVLTFLLLKPDNQKTILEHLEADTPEIQKILEIETQDYKKTREQLLLMKYSESKAKTDGRVKQVYFPCEDGYHLLSILTPSGLLYEMRNRIHEIRFSEATKQAREDKKNQRYNQQGYEDLPDLTMIGYGGSKPQNISTLNNKYAGKAYALPSFPPELPPQKIRLPISDFYQNSLFFKEFKRMFVELDKLFHLSRKIGEETQNINNMHVRRGIENIYAFIISSIMQKIKKMRNEPAGWTEQERFERLPKNQKILLDNLFQEKRKENEDWFSDFKESLSLWINNAYEKNIQKSVKVTLADKVRVKNLIDENKEELT